MFHVSDLASDETGEMGRLTNPMNPRATVIPAATLLALMPEHDGYRCQRCHVPRPLR